MAETITKYYAMDDSLLQYGQEGGETNPNATTMQDMQAYMKQNGDTLEHVVNSILWQPETDYVVGQEIHSPNIPAGYIAVCSVAGQSGETEPSWSTTYSTFTDGTVTWNIVGSVAILSGGKANVGDCYTKAESNTLLGAKAPLTSPAFLTSATLDGKNLESVEESGTNYIRYASGLQICWGNIASAGGGDATVFPKAFISNPSVAANVNTSAINYAFSVAISGVITTQFSHFLQCVINGVSQAYGNSWGGYYLAIGRWK